MINHLPCSIKTLDNPDRDQRITEASIHKEVRESGTELGISVESECEENIADLKSEDRSEKYDTDISESGSSEDNDMLNKGLLNLTS